MLSFFRSGGFGRVLVAGIAFAIILVFALEFRAGSNSGPSADLARECAVEFGGYCVDPKEFYAAHGMIVPRGIEPKQAKALALNKKVLDGLVERELLVSEARKLGLEAGQDALDQDLTAGRVRASLPAQELPDLAFRLGLCRASDAGYGCALGSEYPVRQLQVRRTADEPFDYKLYERQVRLVTNRGPKEFKEMQEREFLAAKLREIVRARVRIPEPEALLLFQRDRAKMVVRSVNLQRDWFAKFAVRSDEESVTRFTLAHQAQVDADWEGKKADFTAGCTLGSEVFVELSVSALEDEKTVVKQQAEQVRERIAKGESLANVARELSRGATAILGGELGCIGKNYGIGADELLKASESLQPGELSPVIESPRGFHVLRVTGKLAADKVEETGRRHVARRLYARFSADEALTRFAEQLISRTKAGEKLEEATRALSLSFASEARGDRVEAGGASKAAELADGPALLAQDRPKFEVSAPFNISSNPLPDLDPSEPLAGRAFELKQPEEVFARPLTTSTGAVVLQLKERTDPSHEEFVKEKANVVAALMQAKASEALIRYVQELRRAAGEKLKVVARFGEDSKSSSSNE